MLNQPVIENGQRGVILNMSSILGIDPEPEYFDTVAYATSKGGIVAMSRSIAASCAKEKIRVNVIAPSLVRTPMSARASEDQNILDFLRVKHPWLGEVIPVEDVAAACVYLLTDASHGITGQTLILDAGWSLTWPNMRGAIRSYRALKAEGTPACTGCGNEASIPAVTGGACAISPSRSLPHDPDTFSRHPRSNLSNSSSVALPDPP